MLKRIRGQLVPALAILLLACPTPQARPGPAYDGSAHWALGIAQPLITPFAPDAQLYSVLRARIYPDGRLPSNVGDWSFIAWSASRQQEIQVTVNYDGTTHATIRSQTTAPGSGLLVPAAWANSTAIFQATIPHRPSVGEAQLVAVNMSRYNHLAWNQPVWSIHFDQGPNQLVKWDGTYLGAQ